MLRVLRDGDKDQIIVSLIVYLMIIFLITPIHEFAHAWAAYKMGDDTAKLKGRLTLNPIASIDPVGTLAILLVGFGWGKPVPINPLRFKKYRKGLALTAAAGPLSNLIVATISMTVQKFVWAAACVQKVNGNIERFDKLYLVFYVISLFTLINVGLAVFNLIPIPPLDGSKIMMYFTNKKIDDWMHKNMMMLQGLLMAVIYMTPILGYARQGVYNLLDKMLFFVDKIAWSVMS